MWHMFCIWCIMMPFMYVNAKFILDSVQSVFILPSQHPPLMAHNFVEFFSIGFLPSTNDWNCSISFGLCRFFFALPKDQQIPFQPTAFPRNPWVPLWPAKCPSAASCVDASSRSRSISWVRWRLARRCRWPAREDRGTVELRSWSKCGWNLAQHCGIWKKNEIQIGCWETEHKKVDLFKVDPKTCWERPCRIAWSLKLVDWLLLYH